MGFFLISFELAKIQMQDFAVCFVTIYYCLQKMARKFVSNVQVGDNWSSTSNMFCHIFFQDTVEHDFINDEQQQRACLECSRSWVQAEIGSNQDYKMGICCFSAKHTALRRKSKNLLAQNQDNVSERGDMSIHRFVSVSQHYNIPFKHVGLVHHYLIQN